MEPAPECLRAIGDGILLAATTSPGPRDDSPPERILEALLRLALGASDVRVVPREAVRIGHPHEHLLEIDLLIEQPTTGAAAAIEIDSWRHHDRNAQSQMLGIQRDRLLRRAYRHVERYAALEVLSDPWTVLLEIADNLETRWDDFTVRVAPAVRELALACASPSPVALVRAGPMQSRPVSIRERLCRVAEASPPPPTSDPVAVELRRTRPRSYAPWLPPETSALREAWRSGLDMDVIADSLGRTDRACWARLAHMGLVSR